MDTPNIVEALKAYSDGTLPFVVFSNGTTCMFPRGMEPDFKVAMAALSSLAARHSDCIVREMKDGNYLVNFGDPIFGLVLKQRAASVINSSTNKDRNLAIAVHAKANLRADIGNSTVVAVYSGA